jgi:hypothetical protein
MKKHLTLQNVGWLITGILILMLGQSIIGKLDGSMTANFQFMHLENYMIGTAVTEIVGLGLLIYPRTSIYGAILLSCLMSGAVALHLSLMGGNMVMAPITMGLLAWLSHCLRSHRLSRKK